MKQRLKSFGLVTLAWIVGLLLACVGGLFLAMLVAGPAATIAAPLVLGLVVGAAQRRVLNARAILIALTAVGALAGWLLGTFVAFRLTIAGLGVVAPWIGGLVIGTLVGSAQAVVALPDRRKAVRWIAANALVWTMALGPLLAPNVPPFVRLLSLLVPGLFASVMCGVLSLTSESFPRSLRQRSRPLVAT